VRTRSLGRTKNATNTKSVIAKKTTSDDSSLRTA
jgi:hypothetical protein